MTVYTRRVFEVYDREHEVPVSGKMSSEEEDVFLCLINKYRKKKLTKRKFWVHPYLAANNDEKFFVAAKEMIECDDFFFLTFYRTSKTTFSDLLQIEL